MAWLKLIIRSPVVRMVVASALQCAAMAVVRATAQEAKTKK